MPDKAIDLIDEAGARVKLRATSIPEEMINIQRRIRVIDGRIESAISAQEFEKAARYRLEEDLEQESLQVIKERWKLRTTVPLKVTREDIEEVIAKWTGIPVSSLHEEEMAQDAWARRAAGEESVSATIQVGAAEAGQPVVDDVALVAILALGLKVQRLHLRVCRKVNIELAGRGVRAS